MPEYLCVSRISQAPYDSSIVVKLHTDVDCEKLIPHEKSYLPNDVKSEDLNERDAAS